jgi:hypothetical protein
MIIQVVEPSRFCSRIVDERRPLSLEGDVLYKEPEHSVPGILLGAAVLVLILGAFTFVVTYGLKSFLAAV